ncbi:hypothetical protein BREVNS_0806 [Brevinematales bacterium NS]|nr:polysaccharide pyruvyl transferase family protein [Brevinematales bacterium]QJR21556.1 hypothetical protein BREVNS_0806 [Brevinematales bacterium NS]
MKIVIIGWYGTETIGDRAIVAGLISFFKKSFGDFEIQLGSLYPFFSQRTIVEDYDFYKEIISKDIKISIFDSKDSRQLDNAIRCSDIVIMGGGPLMDLDELFMIEYAFKKARKLAKKTALLGCGVGPLFKKKYWKSVLEIVEHSDLVILRDSLSKERLKYFCKEEGKFFDYAFIKTSYDPAVESVLEFGKRNIPVPQEYVAINLRKFPSEYIQGKDCNDIDRNLKNFVKDVALKYSQREIRLIPMHYFHIGNDDRFFLNDIAMDLNLPNIYVQNSNLTLKQTIETYQNAYFNIGMRFHAVVMQTMVSGKNYILDYTEPQKGKIIGFLSDIDKNGFYKERYISLQEQTIDSTIIRNEEDRFVFDIEKVYVHLNVYVEELRGLW